MDTCKLVESPVHLVHSLQEALDGKISCDPSFGLWADAMIVPAVKHYSVNMLQHSVSSSVLTNRGRFLATSAA